MDDMLKSVSVLFEKAIHFFFKILMAGMVIAVFFIDKSIENPFPNTAKWSNAGYFLVAGAMLGIFGVCVVCKCNEVSEKLYRTLMVTITTITGLAQLVICKWVPTELMADFYYVRTMAIELANGGVLTGNSYFQESPNNINITLVLAAVYYKKMRVW